MGPDAVGTAMKFRLGVRLAAAALLLAAAPALGATPPAAPAGATLAGSPAQGRALYTYDKDGKGASKCEGPCLTSWPALTAGPDAEDKGSWTVFARPDGARQWAYKGKPVYGFYRDTPGAPAGGDNKVPGWHLLK